MLFDSPTVERLVEAFRRLPGVGKRSAERLALHMLTAPRAESVEMSEVLLFARDRIQRCSVCCNLTEDEPCSICSDARRNAGTLCVVEDPVGAMAIESAGAFQGSYHVLHGALNPLDGVGPDELTISALLKRLESSDIQEVIIATNATSEGEATALYLGRVIGQQCPNTKVSRIAHGVPMGGGLEFADEATLAHALDGRKSL